MGEATDPVDTVKAFLHGLPVATLPSPDELLQAAGGPGAARAALAAAELARAGWLLADDDGAQRFLDVARTLAPADSNEATALALWAAELWLAVTQGTAGDIDAATHELHRRAVAARLPLRAVEAVAISAWAALGEDRVPQAIDAARRASRMGRTEALPEAEWLANLALARARRHGGRPHLAIRILVALTQTAPRPWWGALAWELALSGASDRAAALLEGQPIDTPPLQDVAGRAARALVTVLAAARDGRRDRLDDAHAELTALIGGRSAMAREAAGLVAALDPDRPVPPALADWAEGRATALPGGLQGAAGVAAGTPTAIVLARPGHLARRVLAGGAGLLAALGADPGTLVGSAHEHYRTDQGLAVLALAGPAGISLQELFRAVYLISFVPRVHEGILRVLAHRMRRRLGDGGEITREGERLSLIVRRALALPDPRCTRPTEDAVLELLAALGHCRSEDVAAQLGISVRSAQAALRQLVDEGACLRDGKGPAVRYRVDDTTFADPTRPDLMAR